MQMYGNQLLHHIVVSSHYFSYDETMGGDAFLVNHLYFYMRLSSDKTAQLSNNLLRTAFAK